VLLRLAVGALNPPAGEGGVIGNEETSEIASAVETVIQEGIPANGPYPPDIFFRAAQGAFDGVIAQCRDQGHIDENVGASMRLLRWPARGTSDPRSMIQAIKLAGLMTLGRMRARQLP